jgi:hypothetical protein
MIDLHMKQGTAYAEDPEMYQGWTNRETWAARLYLSGDREATEACREIVRDPETYPCPDKAVAEFFEIHFGYGNSSPVLLAMFQCAMNRVNWQKVAESFADNW